MSARLKQPVPAEGLAKQLGLDLIGPSRELREICSLDSLVEDGLSFVLRSRRPAPQAIGTVFAPAAVAVPGLSVIRSPNPRLDFIRAQHLMAAAPGFVEDASLPQVHPSVQVGPNSVIENGVRIGEGTRIGSCVVIKSGTRIGRYCDIKSGAVIGEAGFGFERDENHRPLRMIHLGGVRIGDHVEIGSLTTVARGALGDTVLEDHVKVDDHSHIAHNCHIGEATIITACVEISGSVIVGKNAWLAPNCCIVQKVRLGDNCFIGIGSVVSRSVEPGEKVFGNPARRLAAPAPPAAKTASSAPGNGSR
jgi:UDP-3-O-[3-hydroxymyristoyl] glucosamine N-acyltransferase